MRETKKENAESSTGKATSVIDYIVQRLADEGITDCFGVPGDYAFPVCDAVDRNPNIRWVGCSNELNASYAADGYARVRGAAMLSTTYAVGELSAINGVMGAKAERSLVYHVVGMPSYQNQRLHKIMHHTFGDGVFGNFVNISAQAACCYAVIDPDNCMIEMERVIAEARRNNQPPYYWRCGETEVDRHYSMIAEAGDLPVVIYHNPALSKFNITPKFAGKLATIPGVVAFKEVLTDLQHLEALYDEVGGRADIYNTFRAMLAGLMLGAAGGFINIFAVPAAVALLKAYKAGDYQRAEEIQRRLNRCFPRGGEETLGHLGTTKVTASVATGIEMGPRAAAVHGTCRRRRTNPQAAASAQRGHLRWARARATITCRR